MGWLTSRGQNSLLVPRTVQVRLPQPYNTITSGGGKCHSTHIPFHLPHLKVKDQHVHKDLGKYSRTFCFSKAVKHKTFQKKK